MKKVEDIFSRYCSDKQVLKNLDYFMSHDVNANNEVISLEIFDSEYHNEFPITNRLGEFIGEFKKLRNLEIEIDYPIKDLSSLSDLYELENISIEWETEVENIDFVRNMMNLKMLYLASSKVKNIDVLIDKKQLTSVSLPFAQIEDISALYGLLDLVWINFSDNKIKDIESIKRCQKLQSFNFRNNQISSIESFRELYELTFIDINNNQITDLSPIENLRKLSRIDAGNNRIITVGFWNNFQDLSILNISNNRITNIDTLVNCKQISYLNIADNLIENIDFLAGKQLLNDLNISNNPIRSIEVVQNLKALKKLNSAHLKTVDFYEGFEFQSALLTLDLSHCDLENVSFLSNQHQLIELNLCHNQLSNFDDFKHLYQLSNLNLQHNQLTDVFPIYYFLEMKAVDLRGNEFGDKLFGKFSTTVVSSYSNYTSIFDAAETESEGTIKQLKKLVADDYLEKGNLEAALAFYYFDNAAYASAIEKEKLNISLYYLKHLSNRNSPFVYTIRRRIITAIKLYFSESSEQRNYDYYMGFVLNIDEREIEKPKGKIHETALHLYRYPNQSSNYNL